MLPSARFLYFQEYGIFTAVEVVLVFSPCLIESMLAFLITALTAVRKASLWLTLKLGSVFLLKLLASYAASWVKHEQTKQT